jgi:hypothetical protein
VPIEQECKICKRLFTLTKEQEALYESKRAANHPLALGCPLCGRTWMLTFAKQEKEEAHPQYRCPVSHCAGWVDCITAPKAKPFWGCGACGARWLDVENLYEEISAMAARYPYRKKCYKKAAGGKWLPVPLAEQPGNYEEQVEQEPFDKKNDFVRG